MGDNRNHVDGTGDSVHIEATQLLFIREDNFYRGM